MASSVAKAALSKANKAISVDINTGHSFTSTTQRDTFFLNNPTQLEEDMYIYCDGQLQQYIDGSWVDRSAAIQGTNGNDGEDGIGIQSITDNSNNTFTITLTNGTTNIINKIDTINSDDITQGTVKLLMTVTERNKLAGIESGAEVNNISDTNVTDLTDNGDTSLHYHSSDRNRANHTGTQAISTITDLQTNLDNKLNKDFTTYTQKSDIVALDKISINDSEDTNSVKYVTVNQLVSSVQDPHNKGYFATGVDLNTAIPSASDGDFAVVGETDSIWVWSSVTSDFVNSGVSGVVASVNGKTGIVTLTKTDIGLENVVNLDTSTTVNITDSTDKRFVTDANLVVLGNTSGINTGDETNETIKTKLGTDLTNKVDKVDGKSLVSDDEITRLSTVVNYDDTAITGRVSNLENVSHTHTNKTVLDNTTASFTTDEKTKLAGIEIGATKDVVMVGATTEANGTSGLTPQPLIADKDKFLCGDGTWKTVSGGGGVTDIGGTNLLCNSGWINNFAGWFISSGWVRDETVKFDRFNNLNTYKISRTGLSSTNLASISSLTDTEYSIPCAFGDTFTASIYVLTDNYTNIDSSCLFNLIMLDSSNTIVGDLQTVSIKPTENNKWTRFTITHTIDNADAVKIKISATMYQNGNLWIACPKIEKGEIATDYSISIKDDISKQKTYTLLATNWTGTVEPYVYTLTVDGLNEYKNPLVNLVNSSDYNNALAIGNLQIAKITQGNWSNPNKLYFYAKIKPTFDFDVNIEIKN